MLSYETNEMEEKQAMLQQPRRDCFINTSYRSLVIVCARPSLKGQRPLAIVGGFLYHADESFSTSSILSVRV